MSLKPKQIDFNATWSGLCETIHGVVTLGRVNRESWNNRFSDVYSLCVAHPEPLADKLYFETKKFLEQHVSNMMVNVEGESNYASTDETEGEALLQRYFQAWTEYSQGINYLNYLYLYLNQQHIKKQKMSEAEVIYGNTDASTEKMEIGELGLISWENALNTLLRERIKRALLAGVQASRENRPHQVNIIKTVIHSFVEMQQFKKKNPLDLYMRMVEEPLLEATGEHCKRLAADLLQRCNVSEYMKEVLAGLEQEMDRGGQFLHTSSLGKLKKVYEKQMVEDNLDFLHGECKLMVEEEREEDLRNIYLLLKPTALTYLTEIISEHIKNQGLEALSNLQGDKVHNQFVEKMLSIYNKFKILIDQVFAGDKVFIDVLDKACASIINASAVDQPCKSPIYLARYCDGLLKKNTRGSSETEAEDRLASSIVIFKYIDDKDVFQKYYSQLMANRLIHQQSYSMEQEELMIKRLKETCGYEFTNKLLRMFTDMTISGDLNCKFQDYLKENDVNPGIGFSIHVLQSGAWPWSGANAYAAPIPIQLEKPIQLFETFYNTLYNGRKLTWLQHQCMGELRVSYPRKTYLITMQTALMALMLEFESTNTLTISELMKASRLTTDHLARHLSSLIEFQLLVAEGKISDVNTVIRFNLMFTNKRTKLRIPLSMSGSASGRDQSEAERTTASVEEDRKMFLQAAIVRIMKARKLLKHNELVQEVLGQAKVAFSPNVAMIKKCIEILIEKQYIERTLVSDEYSYLA